MAFDFPSSPAPDAVFTDPTSGASYVWSGETWKRQPAVTNGGGGGTPVDAYTKSESDARYEPFDSAYTKAESDALYVAEAPLDSTPYARRNAAWVPADLMTADRPILNTITPATAAAAAGPIEVTLSGSKFSVTAKVYFGNAMVVSLFVSPSVMTFVFDPSHYTVGPHAVTVNNTGLSSQPRTFTIT
jgi:hypothetical protein